APLCQGCRRARVRIGLATQLESYDIEWAPRVKPPLLDLIDQVVRRRDDTVKRTDARGIEEQRVEGFDATRDSGIHTGSFGAAAAAIARSVTAPRRIVR